MSHSNRNSAESNDTIKNPSTQNTSPTKRNENTNIRSTAESTQLLQAQSGETSERTDQSKLDENETQGEIIPRRKNSHKKSGSTTQMEESWTSEATNSSSFSESSPLQTGRGRKLTHKKSFSLESDPGLESEKKSLQSDLSVEQSSPESSLSQPSDTSQSQVNPTSSSWKSQPQRARVPTMEIGKRNSFLLSKPPIINGSFSDIKSLGTSSELFAKRATVPVPDLTPRESPLIGSPRASVPIPFFGRSSTGSLPSPGSRPKVEQPKEPSNFFVTDIGNNFFKYLESGDFSDVILKLKNGQTYKAHKLILSYSSGHFLKLFTENPSLGEGGKSFISEITALPLLALSEKFAISELRKLVSLFLASTVRMTNAVQMLKRALKTDVTPMVEQCMLVIAKHFRFIYDEDLYKLPFAIFLQILKHDKLNVQNEYELYQAVLKFVVEQKQTLVTEQTTEGLSELFRYIRYRFMSYRQFEEVIRNPLVPRDILVEAGICRLATHEAPKSVEKISSGSKNLQPRSPQSITIDFSGDPRSVGQGILHWIGLECSFAFADSESTNCRRGEWQSPTTRGVKVIASSIEKGNPNDLVRKFDVAELWTKDVPSSWFCIDLGPNRKVIPTYYTLVHNNYEADILRNWQLQGSNEGEDNWTTLVKHVNDFSLGGKFAPQSWPVEGVSKGYRFFRILQTGHNSSNRNYLVLSGMELFGELFED